MNIQKSKLFVISGFVVCAMGIALTFGFNNLQADPDCDMCCLKCDTSTTTCVCDSSQSDGCRCDAK